MSTVFRFLSILTIVSLLACTTENNNEGAKSVPKVTASQVYQDLYGQPPTVRAGQAQALVGYLPNESGKALITFPLFMIGEDERLESMVHQLLSMTASSDFMPNGVLPFPEGVELLKIKQEKGALHITLSSPVDDFSTTAYPAALSHSLTQFTSVDTLILELTEEGQPEAVPVSIEQRPVKSPSKPEILFAAAADWRVDGSPEELSIYFDRPIQVEQFSLSLKNGTAIPGDYYTSAFDMAVVVHPESGSTLTEGTELRVKWKIVDAKGRSASNDTLLSLRRVEHL